MKTLATKNTLVKNLVERYELTSGFAVKDDTGEVRWIYPPRWITTFAIVLLTLSTIACGTGKAIGPLLPAATVVAPSVPTTATTPNGYTAWNVATAYVPGDVVGFNGKDYTAVLANTGDEPDQFLSIGQSTNFVFTITTNPAGVPVSAEFPATITNVTFTLPTTPANVYQNEMQGTVDGAPSELSFFLGTTPQGAEQFTVTQVSGPYIAGGLNYVGTGGQLWTGSNAAPTFTDGTIEQPEDMALESAVIVTTPSAVYWTATK